MKLRPGLTYLEVMLAIALVAAIALALGNFTSTSFRQWRLTREQINLQDRTRNALLDVIKEIREMQTSESGAFAIESATSASVVFFADVDDDGVRERVRYFVNGTQLQRGIIEPVGTTYPAGSEVIDSISDDVYLDGALFAYFDENYTGTQDPLTEPITATNIHLIKIRFLVDVDPSQAPEPIEMTTEVTLRNLKAYAPTP